MWLNPPIKLASMQFLTDLTATSDNYKTGQPRLYTRSAKLVVLVSGMKSRSRRLGLETASRFNFDGLGLVSVSGKFGKVSSRSRLEQNFIHLRLVSVSSAKASFTT